MSRTFSSFSLYGVEITDREMKLILSSHGIAFEETMYDESIESEIEDVVDKVESDAFDEIDDEDEDDDDDTITDEYEDNESDACQKFEELADEHGLFCYILEDENQVFIGREWCSIGDHETGLEFKKSTEEKIEKLLGRKQSCETIEEAIDE